MIQIIKRGTKKIATCYSCGCIFSYEKEDIGTYIDKEWVICPQCEREVILKSEREIVLKKGG